MERPANCAHENFQANVGVHRLSDEPDGPINRYSADITIKCRDCGEPFQFIGVKAGLSFAEPMVGIDGEELRCPIGPKSLRLGPLDGALDRGRAHVQGFTVRPPTGEPN